MSANKKYRYNKIQHNKRKKEPDYIDVSTRKNIIVEPIEIIGGWIGGPDDKFKDITNTFYDVVNSDFTGGVLQ